MALDDQLSNKNDTEMVFNIPFLNNVVVRAPLFVEMQIISILRTIKEAYDKSFVRLSVIAGPLLKTSIVLMSISVLIEDVMCIKALRDIYLRRHEIEQAEKIKMCIQAIMSFLTTVIVGIFAAITFGVKGVVATMAIAALPLLTGVDLLYSAVMMSFNRADLHQKECAYSKITANLSGFYTQSNEMVQMKTELEFAQKSMSNEQQGIIFKTIIFIGALLTVVTLPPVMIIGFALVAIGIMGMIKTACDQAAIDAEKKRCLPEKTATEHKFTTRQAFWFKPNSRSRFETETFEAPTMDPFSSARLY